MVSCENSWAGRLVICLQLLSWCAVGALLLHRGISSVKPEVDRQTLTTPSYSDVQTNITANYSQYEEPTLGRGHESKLAEKSATSNKHLPSKLTTVGNSLGQHDFNSSSIAEPAQKNDVEKGNVTATTTESSPGSRASSKMTPMITHNVRVGQHRKNLVLTPSGVIMAALGAIMLILGPSIVILRCCDNSRQGRFSKLSADEYALAMSALDRPPAYEEVADNAPRYSALFPDEDDDVAVQINNT